MFFIWFLESKAFVTRFAIESNVSIFYSRFHFLFFVISNNSLSGLFCLFNFIFLRWLNILWIDNLGWTVFRMLLVRLCLNFLGIAIIWVSRLHPFSLIIFHANTFGYCYIWFCLLVLLLLLLLFPLSPIHIFVMFLLSRHHNFFFFLLWDSLICKYVQLRLLSLIARHWKFHLRLILFNSYFVVLILYSW